LAPSDEPGLTVIWATDGSDSSRSAIPFLRRLVLPATRRLTILSVAPQSFISGARPDPSFLTRSSAGARRRAVLEAEATARQAATQLDPVSTEVEVVARWGNPIEEILRASRAARADLIAMGAKGHSNLGLILLGSVSQGVVQNANRPVLIARPDSGNLRSVLVGFDGSSHARRAVAFLQRLNLPPEVSLRIAYVVEPFKMAGGANSSFRRRAMEEAEKLSQRRGQEAERSLAQLAAALRSTGREVETEVLHGAAGPRLDEAAQEHAADLIVVGSRKPSPASHYLLGSTAEKLVRHSSVSVLIVR
jgi:nucleotide-binding universal stress UspA family protein